MVFDISRKNRFFWLYLKFLMINLVKSVFQGISGKRFLQKLFSQVYLEIVTTFMSSLQNSVFSAAHCLLFVTVCAKCQQHMKLHRQDSSSEDHVFFWRSSTFEDILIFRKPNIWFLCSNKSFFRSWSLVLASQKSYCKVGANRKIKPKNRFTQSKVAEQSTHCSLLSMCSWCAAFNEKSETYLFAQNNLHLWALSHIVLLSESQFVDVFQKLFC